jgi:hypothetical protein
MMRTLVARKRYIGQVENTRGGRRHDEKGGGEPRKDILKRRRKRIP